MQRTRRRTLGAVAGGAVVAAALALTQAVVAQAPTFGPAPAGQPNLQGVWRAWNLARYDLEAHGARPGVPAGLGFVVDPADGKIPYRPEALEKRKQLLTAIHEADPYKNSDPLAKCYLPGVPRITYMGWPFQIIQTANAVSFAYEWSHKKRLVPIGAKPPAPAEEGEGNWMGMPRGRFENGALVVDITNFNPYTWFDAAGNHHSDALKVTEKYTPMGPDTLQYEATITDPKTFTRPWTMRMTLQRQKDIGLLDYECTAMLDELGIHHTWPRDFDVQ